VDTEEDVVMGAFRHRQQPAGLVYDLIPPERKEDRKPQTFSERRPEIVDAEFVTVLPVRGTAFSAKDFKASRKRAAVPPVPQSPMLAVISLCLRVVERWLQQASARSFAALVLAMFVLVFGLCGGFSGLSARPAAALTDPLQFSHVTLTPRDANGMRILVLNGIIDNGGRSTLGLKPIRADLVSGDRLLASVVIAPPSDQVGAGESRGFMARLQYPGGKMPDVRLSFMP
jgi:hypothetical protein